MREAQNDEAWPCCVWMCVSTFCSLHTPSAQRVQTMLVPFSHNRTHAHTQEHRHAHQHEQKKEREQQSAKIQKKGASKVAGIAKSAPPKAKTQKPTTRMASRLTIDDERDLIVAVLAQHFRGPAAKQAWFRELGSDLRDAVLAKWLETFRCPGSCKQSK
jgi:hypothetical protein